MPTPTEFSERAGTPIVYRRSAGGSWNADANWTVFSVELGSRDRISLATIRYNRDKVLRKTVAEQIISQDDVWLLAYTPNDGGVTSTAIFQGTPKLIQRQLSGVMSNAMDTGELLLQDAAVLWADAEASQIYGRYMANLRAATIAANCMLAHDASLPCVFNSGGRPNRSRWTAKDSRFDDGSGSTIAPFDTANQYDCHYFSDDDGADIDAVYLGTGKSAFAARYWTYAQALAYVLNFHAGSVAKSDMTTAAVRNGIRLWFGYPPGNTPPGGTAPRETDETTLWGALIGPDRTKPLYKVLQESERLGSPAFDDPDDPGPYQTVGISPAALLNARCHDLSIEGMNVIEALGAILHAAGLGWWIDSYLEYTTAAGPTSEFEHIFRVWTPGGDTVKDGIGEQFDLRLQPHGFATAGKTAVEIFDANNAESIDATFDCGGQVNAPLILKAPVQYEITCMLRPGWLPVHDKNNGFIDNVDPAGTFQDEGQTIDTNELDDAVAVLIGAMDVPTGTSDRLFTVPPGFMRRVKTVWAMMHAKGILAAEFLDVMRKWVIPTDRSYPNQKYARDYAALYAYGMPWEFGTYRPADFSEDRIVNDSLGAEVPAFILNPIQGASEWPTRRRPMLPCLTCDANRQTINVVVEICLDGGRLDGSLDGVFDTELGVPVSPANWFRVTAFRVLQDECGIYLTAENPFDIRNPYVKDTVGSYQFDNLALAYVHHKARVRATFTIEGSSIKGAQYPDIVEGASELPDPTIMRRSRVVQRRGRYKKTVNLGQFKDLTTNQTGLISPIGPAKLLNDNLDFYSRRADEKWFYMRKIDHAAAARAELARHQAVAGDWKVSGKFVVPWPETDCRPGMVVTEVAETGGSSSTVARNLDFRALAGPGVLVAPHIAGVVYTFDSGGFRTAAVIEDWRAIAELGPQA